MADNRTALDKHLGITDLDRPFTQRYRALTEHVGEALNAGNYAAAQVYATLLLVQAQEGADSIDVRLTNWEELAIAIGANMS
jgi:hypothetical protein